VPDKTTCFAPDLNVLNFPLMLSVLLIQFNYCNIQITPWESNDALFERKTGIFLLSKSRYPIKSLRDEFSSFPCKKHPENKSAHKKCRILKDTSALNVVENRH